MCRLSSGVKSVNMSPSSVKSYNDKYHSGYIEDPTMLSGVSSKDKEELEESIPIYDQILPERLASRQKVRVIDHNHSLVARDHRWRL